MKRLESHDGSGISVHRLDPKTEKALLIRIVRGEKELFRSFVECYQEQTFALIMRQVADRHIAEDLTQEVFIRAYKALSAFRFESSFSTWITTITLNQVHSYFSSRGFRDNRASVPLDDITQRTTGETPEDSMHRERFISGLQQGLRTLSAPLREAFVLTALEGKSYEEAAGILGIPVGTVRSRLNKARLLLKEAIP